MALNNKNRYEVLNRTRITLEDTVTPSEVEHYTQVIDKLQRDSRSKANIHNLEGFLIRLGLERRKYKLDRSKGYVKALTKDDEFIDVIENPYSTMYIYSSLVINNPLVCNDELLKGIKKAEKIMLRKYKIDLMKLKLERFKAMLNILGEEFVQEEANFNKVLKNNQK